MRVVVGGDVVGGAVLPDPSSSKLGFINSVQGGI